MTDGSENKELAPCLLQFSGKQDDWHMWSRFFLARSLTKNYKDIVTGTEPPPPTFIPGTQGSSSVDKGRLAMKENFRKANSTAYMELLSAVFDDISFNTFDEARSATFPDGNSALAWNGLLCVFKPAISASKVVLRKRSPR
jgi:hypothetical protein